MQQVGWPLGHSCFLAGLSVMAKMETEAAIKKVAISKRFINSDLKTVERR
jgi:hypothetical protein